VPREFVQAMKLVTIGGPLCVFAAAPPSGGWRSQLEDLAEAAGLDPDVVRQLLRRQIRDHTETTPARESATEAAATTAEPCGFWPHAWCG
jgi:hypothetical protein